MSLFKRRRGRGVPEEPSILSPEELLARLPASARQSVEEWPFADIPLGADPAPEIARPALLRQAGTLVARVIGLVSPSPDFEEFQLRVDDGETGRSMWLALHVPGDPHRYTQLGGLLMDASVKLLPTLKDVEYWRDGTLQTVHGIQMPLRPGEPEGVARGIVQTVDRSLTSKESYGMRLSTAGGQGIWIGWNPSLSLRLHEAQVLEPDSVVALQVRQPLGATSYHSDVRPGTFCLLEGPRELVE